ncbi:Hypothetical protein AT6N2_L2249 [Agrobacterium tumefaciens]|nr:Hypothetical protein AT6N2_L2249 [Agrobacterium tumefaciens]
MPNDAAPAVLAARAVPPTAPIARTARLVNVSISELLVHGELGGGVDRVGLRCDLEHRDAVDQLGIEEAVLQLTKGSGIERVVPVRLLGGASGDAGRPVHYRNSHAFGRIAVGRGKSGEPANRLRRDDAEAARRCDLFGGRKRRFGIPDQESVATEHCNRTQCQHRCDFEMTRSALVCILTDGGHALLHK